MRKILKTTLFLVAIFCLVAQFCPRVTAIGSGCNHNWYVCERSTDEHTEKCSFCGNVRTNTHTYNITSDGSCEYISDDYHKGVCETCEQISLFPHDWKAGLFKLWAYCDACGHKADNKTYALSYHSKTPAQCNDEHLWVIGSYSANEHVLECHYCAAVSSEAHNWISTSGDEYICSIGCQTIVGECVPNVKYRIENYYSTHGPHQVRSQEFGDFVDPEGQFNHIKIWYPDEMLTTDEKWPVVVFCNGTGSAYGPNQNGKEQTDQAGYTALFEHFASWGFVLIANNRGGSASSTATDTTLGYLLNKNATVGDLFYQKIDTTRIGIAGHSQGATAALQNICGRTVTEDVDISYQYADMYKAVWAASPNKFNNTYRWTYDPVMFRIPVFMVCEENTTWFLETISEISYLQENLTAMQAPGIIGQGSNRTHGDMVSCGKGYMIAWFRYILLEDSFAAQAFIGEDAEYFINDNWNEQESKNLSQISP